MPRKIKYKNLIAAAGIFASFCASLSPGFAAEADVRSSIASCPDVKIIFARGSGAERWNNDNYETFRDEVSAKIGHAANFEFEDLGYPAVGIGVDNLDVLVGAAVGSGDAYKFGESVDKGVEMLKKEVNETCPETKFVVAGYSQGAMVVSKALPELLPNKIIYAATFGDPKIYLPEGRGPVPDACFDRNLSEYREYVPDCMVYKGLLGGYVPYQPEGFSGKVGTWCNKTDIFCSTYLSVTSHVSYVSDGIYAAASEKIAEKILAEVSPAAKDLSGQDTMILFNVNWYDAKFFNEYTAAAREYGISLLSGGARVAVYAAHTEYGGGAMGIRICGFEDCTAEKITKYFNDEIQTFGYPLDYDGEIINNIFGAAFSAVTSENWRVEAEKTLVIYSKEGYDDEKRYYTETLIDGKHSLAITRGAVNLVAEPMRTMARRNLGAGVLGVMNAEDFNTAVELPEIKILEVDENGTEVKISFSNTGAKAILTLNGAILGVTEGNEVTITGVDRSQENIISLVPMNETRRGFGAEVEVLPEVLTEVEILAPNAGRR